MVKLSHRCVIALVGALGSIAVPAIAHAQDSRDLGAAAPQAPAVEGINTGTPYWSAGKRRFFAAGALDLGGIFARAELDLGWGKPHRAWGGIESWTRVTIGGVTFYAGPRFSIPHFQVRAGLRTFSSADTHLLLPSHDYDRLHLDLVNQPLSHYGSLDADMLGYFALGPGTASILATVHGLIGVDHTSLPGQPSYYVYEDAFHIIVKPPWFWSARVAYLANIGKYDDAGIGAAVEVINVPDRTFATTVRVGPVVTVSLTHHLQATGAALIAVASRDNLGLAGGDLGQIGLRYRWATGDLWPEFP